MFILTNIYFLPYEFLTVYQRFTCDLYDFVQIRFIFGRLNEYENSALKGPGSEIRIRKYQNTGEHPP